MSEKKINREKGRETERKREREREREGGRESVCVRENTLQHHIYII